jgi:hypothetical protein
MRAMYALCLLVFLAAACAPTTRYRREALVPSPQAPPYRGETMGQKHMEFQVQLAGSHVEQEDLVELHDDALWVPEFMINAAGMFGVVDFLDLGFVVSYAHYAWANRSAHGTPPPPNNDGKHVFAIGPQLGMGAKFLDGKLFTGGYLSLQYARLPWSEWALRDPDDPLHSACYEPIDDGGDNEFYYRLGVYFGGRPIKWLALNVGIVVHASWINDGFTNEEKSGSTLEQALPVIMPLIGARLDMKMIFLETFLTFPISMEQEIDYFPVGWSAGLGVRI